MSSDSLLLAGEVPLKPCSTSFPHNEGRAVDGAAKTEIRGDHKKGTVVFRGD